MTLPSAHRPNQIESAYQRAISLYPLQFRQSYETAMMQSLRDALADPVLSRPAFLRTLLKDLIQSLIKENLAMLRETVSRPVVLYNALILIALFSALTLGFVIIEQNSLRQSANDPQLGMATDLASRLARGVSIAAAVPNDQTDMDASLSAFVIAYDEQGQVLASSAQLNGAVPQLPRGVLDFVRRNGEERVTWAPRRDVRIASVVRHVSGAQGGFVLAGRNLREIESRKDLVLEQAALIWLGLLGIIVVGTFLFGWLTRAPRPAAA
ncbi:hypothetical protein [Acidicapsa acidisoli]|uniref:hypothetical protein n=1 Tax=Acidicapsa acidisoli TaxID=1615681 RepID=UPI0021E047B5|nr:hypothetical protein [Acidicapsa acidisoli]